IAHCKKVLARSRVSNINSIAFVPKNIVYSDATVIFAFDDYASFTILQSMAHTEWLNQNSSSMRNDVRYTPTDCFETFPFPTLTPETEKELETIGEKYYNHRQQIMQTTQLGLTKTYNRFHDPNDTTADIQQLREL
ncbi:MAG: type IIL restriction-modification enzyme MmeI, partial [Pseudanabaena sp.]